MNSEHTEPEPETSWQSDGDRDEAFRCREGPLVVSHEEQVLRAVLYHLPLRAGFTDEVLARIRDCSHG